MYNTSLPHVWSPAPNPHPNPIITRFNYRIIPVGYCIIIVANIISTQLIDTHTVHTSIFRCKSTPEKTNMCADIDAATVNTVAVFLQGNRSYH